jgi:hypothetical protein
VTGSVDLYWLPLGAGGHFVAFNGRICETVMARRENRAALDLYHTALVVTMPEGRFVIESAWPIPDSHGGARGVMVEGPVGASALGRLRVLRYEVRRWCEGTIADIRDAVASPERISHEETTARRVLGLVPAVPPLTWGRKPRGALEMWNSNSVIAWLLAMSGMNMTQISPPAEGRAPGWSTGIAIARRSPKKLGPTARPSVPFEQVSEPTNREQNDQTTRVPQTRARRWHRWQHSWLTPLRSKHN